MTANHTDYPQLVTVLNLLSEQAQKTLGDKLLGLYLQGSFALGAGDVHSDVDFLEIVRDGLSQEDITAIETMHQAIYDTYPQWSSHLEGSYFPVAVLHDETQRYTPVWYLDNGAKTLVHDAHDNEPNVLWVTRERGVTLYGASPETYIPKVNTQALIGNIEYTMTSWSEMIFSGAYSLDNLWAQPFVVMSWCRMMQTLATHEVHSKQAGVHWGLKNLEAKWHDLIQNAWDTRPNPSEKVYQSTPEKRINQTRAFVRYALKRSQPYFNS